MKFDEEDDSKTETLWGEKGACTCTGVSAVIIRVNALSTETMHECKFDWNIYTIFFCLYRSNIISFFYTFRYG